jgi:hypothetical protein
MIKLVPNSWYHITWADAMSHDAGDIKEAKVCVRQNIWRFVRKDHIPWRKGSIPHYIFAYGYDQIDQTNAGWVGLPQAMLLEVELVKTPRNEMTDKEQKG